VLRVDFPVFGVHEVAGVVHGVVGVPQVFQPGVGGSLVGDYGGADCASFLDYRN